MDSTGVSAVTLAGAAAQAQQDGDVAVLKQAMDAEQEVALELIQAMSGPEGLGQNLDARA